MTEEAPHPTIEALEGMLCEPGDLVMGTVDPLVVILAELLKIILEEERRASTVAARDSA
jgi:hypothetical protein